MKEYRWEKGLDMPMLKGITKQIRESALKERIENIKEEFMNIILEEDLVNNFHFNKDRKIVEQSKRVISHWVKKGVVVADQPKKGGWFYFNKTESIWIDIVTQLRKFGLDLDSIIKVRTKLFTEEIDGFKLINFALVYSIMKEPYLLVVEDNGDITVLSSSLYIDHIRTDTLPPHIVLNFLHLAKSVFPNNRFDIEMKTISDTVLTNKEMKLLFYLRTGDYNEIKIRLNSGDTYLIEAKRQIKNADNIMSILKENSYQQMEIKTEKGKIVYIDSTEKLRI
jgi:hypothetical protein